jgi:hypothetical protein
MTSTTTRAADPADRMAGHRMAAAAAVLNHGIVRHLPDPSNVAIEPTLVQLRLKPHTFYAWAQSLVLDERAHSVPATQELVNLYGPCRRWTVAGRLPDLGVRVEISGIMLASADEVA